MARSESEIAWGKEELDWSRIQQFGIQSEGYKLVGFLNCEQRL